MANKSVAPMPWYFGSCLAFSDAMYPTEKGIIKKYTAYNNAEPSR